MDGKKDGWKGLAEKVILGPQILIVSDLSKSKKPSGRRNHKQRKWGKLDFT
jgi:hypothetical protein